MASTDKEGLTMRRGIHHEQWKSRTLSLREDLRAQYKIDPADSEALLQIVDDYIGRWFPEYQEPNSDE